MNEQIQKLYDQADKFAKENRTQTISGPGNNYFELFHEKFAELIIAECLNQVQEQYKPVLEDAVMMKDPHWDGYVQCGVDSYVAIREHFGVKE
jgi:hypothetical protein